MSNNKIDDDDKPETFIQKFMLDYFVPCFSLVAILVVIAALISMYLQLI